MLQIQNIRINTAGAYLCVDGLFVFAIGIRPYQGRIPVVRLGGHREGDETGWQCAAREVYEEANLKISPLHPRATYLSEWNKGDPEIQKMNWYSMNEQEPNPLLVVHYCRENEEHLSLMYLASAEGLPTPSSEVKGLLFLDQDDVHRLCSEPMTLEQYLDRGGQASLNGAFDMTMVLEPFLQLRLLSRILQIQPDVEFA